MQTQTTRPPSSTPPAVSDPSHETTIAGLHERFAGVVCWWGAYTYEWWAIVPGGARWKIVNAEDPDTLGHQILKARNHHQPPAATGLSETLQTCPPPRSALIVSATRRGLARNRRFTAKPEHFLAFADIAATLICHRRLAK